MAGELKKLCALLKSDNAELQCAAALVLGELRPRDSASIKSLGEAVSNGNHVAAVNAARALGRIGSKQALPYLIPCLNAGEERRIAATEAIAALGAAALSSLHKEFGALNAAGRIAAVDIVLDRPNGLDPSFLLGLLTENDSVDVAAHLCERLKSLFEGVSQKARETLLVKLRQFLASKHVTGNPIAVVAGLRLLSYLRSAKSMPVFIEHLTAEQPVAVRRHALNALNSMPLPKGPDADLVRALLPQVADRTYPDLVTLALRILSNVKIPASMTEEMVKLLYSRQSAVRRLAVRALGNFNSSRAAKALLACLDRTDWELGGDTIAALRRISCTADLILKEIDRTEDRERARSLAAILRGAHFKASRSTVESLTRRFFEMLASRHEMSEVYFSLLSSLDTDDLSSRVLDRARQLKSALKFKDAEYHLRLLAQAGPVGADIKYELGLARLKLSEKDIAKPERLTDQSLPLFAELLRDPNFDIERRLDSDKQYLEPEDMFYLGYHFSEGSTMERAFARELFKRVTKAAPRSEISAASHQKMVDEGMARPSKATSARKNAPKPEKAKPAKAKKAPAGKAAKPASTGKTPRKSPGKPAKKVAKKTVRKAKPASTGKSSKTSKKSAGKAAGKAKAAPRKSAKKKSAKKSKK